MAASILKNLGVIDKETYDTIDKQDAPLSIVGIFGLFVVRIQDIFVFNNLKIYLSHLFSCNNKEKASVSQEEPLQQKINSVMSVDYVMIILVGTNNLLEVQTEHQSQMDQLTYAKTELKKVVKEKDRNMIVQLYKFYLQDINQWNIVRKFKEEMPQLEND